jgi:hypothetical protein
MATNSEVEGEIEMEREKKGMPTASKLPTAAKPLSLLLQLHFEGLAYTVADPDTMS